MERNNDRKQKSSAEKDQPRGAINIPKKQILNVVEDFIIPSLDSSKYATLMHWDQTMSCAFLVKWSPNKKYWTVFQDLDRLKGEERQRTCRDRFYEEIMSCKNINEILCPEYGYRRFAITNLKALKRSAPPTL